MILNKKLVFTNHALKRIKERGFTREKVEYMFQIAEKCEFSYKKWVRGKTNLKINHFKFGSIVLAVVPTSGGHKLVTIFDKEPKPLKREDNSHSHAKC